MAAIDPIDLAGRMGRLGMSINEASGWITRHRLFSAAPHGDAIISFSPHTRGGAVDSENFNRIGLLGGRGLTRAGLEELCALLRADGAGHFSIGLMPGPDMAVARTLIKAAGFVRNPWTRYPVLALTGEPEQRMETDILVREVDAAQAMMGEAMWPSYARCAGVPGFHHFLAFDGERPVAHAALAIGEGLGYLGWMATAPADRRRGAQQALIAARVAKARSLGAELIVSETLTLLRSSFANLRHAGFREVYESEIYALPQS